MTKLKKKKRISFLSKKKKKNEMGLINSGIAIMSLLVVAFIFSFSNRQSQTGVPIQIVKFPSTDKAHELSAIQIYNDNPLMDIEIEILNGCGEPGLAAKFSNLLREKRVDVVRSENADHFEYVSTVLILRKENISGMKYVADILGFDIKNSNRIITSIDPSPDVDLTLVIGNDYKSISSIKSYLTK